MFTIKHWLHDLCKWLYFSLMSVWLMSVGWIVMSENCECWGHPGARVPGETVEGQSGLVVPSEPWQVSQIKIQIHLKLNLTTGEKNQNKQYFLSVYVSMPLVFFYTTLKFVFGIIAVGAAYTYVCCRQIHSWNIFWGT